MSAARCFSRALLAVYSDGAQWPSRVACRTQDGKATAGAWWQKGEAPSSAARLALAAALIATNMQLDCKKASACVTVTAQVWAEPLAMAQARNHHCSLGRPTHERENQVRK